MSQWCSCNFNIRWPAESRSARRADRRSGVPVVRCSVTSYSAYRAVFTGELITGFERGGNTSRMICLSGQARAGSTAPAVELMYFNAGYWTEQLDKTQVNVILSG